MDNSMHFEAESKDDIAYYLKSIATMNGLSFDEVDDRFGMTVIHCSRAKMNEDRFNQITEQIIRERSHAKIDYYDDPVGGMRISIK